MRFLFPQAYQIEVSKLRQQLDEAHVAWWKEWKEQQPPFTPENIRFEYRQGWRTRFFSIQSAHDGGHWIWKATKVVWVTAGGSL
jgi:hypothetical protein